MKKIRQKVVYFGPTYQQRQVPGAVNHRRMSFEDAFEVFFDVFQQISAFLPI